RVVRNYDIGIVTNDFSPQGMAEAIKCLTKEKIMYHKNQCHLNARILSAEANIQKIKDIVMGLVSDKTF
ncbi:MAG TPA: hypothetical protein VI757_12165, partial [Bacteroidia bacterium]|nr:hypothetical protein [Bacteroidia bacterium]